MTDLTRLVGLDFFGYFLHQGKKQPSGALNFLKVFLQTHKIHPASLPAVGRGEVVCKKTKKPYTYPTFTYTYILMNISEISDDILGNDVLKSLRFIKNEEGQREAKPLSTEELAGEKWRGIILIGHIDHAKTMIMEALLKANDFAGEVILIEGDGTHKEQGLPMRHAWPNDFPWSMEEILREQMIITARQIDDMSGILLDLKPPKHPHNHIHYVPKTSKSKARPTKKQNQKQK